MLKGGFNRLNFAGRMLLAAAVLILFACAAAFVLPSQKSQAASYKIDGEWYYEVMSDNTVKVIKYTGVGDASGTVVVPATIEGRTVTVLGGKTGCSYEGVFRGNTHIVNVVVPVTVHTIEKAALENCTQLSKISGIDRVAAIGDAAFAGCVTLTNVAFPASATVGNDAFKGCVTLTNVALGAATTSIGSYAFDGCTILSSINIPAKLESIGEYAFRNCDALTSVALPASMKTIGKGAFSECDSLASVSIEGVETITQYAFSNCAVLANVTISNAVRTIEYGAFQNDYSLPAITIPASVRTIGDYAFAGCSGLKSVNMNFGLLEIGENAFKDAFVIENVVIPNSVTTIDYSAFRGCSGIKTMLLPNSLTRIESNAFDDTTPEFQVYSGSYAQKFLDGKGLTYTILEAVPAVGITFTQNTIYLVGGNSARLTYTLSPANTTDAIVWESSYDSVATVNQLGEVTGGDKGTATIIATTTSGIRGQVKVVVSNPVKSISFAIKDKTLNVGDKFTLAAVVKDKDGVRTDIKPTYSSSNPGIAAVDSVTGQVKAVAPGVATITATTDKFTASYKVTVLKKITQTSAGKIINKKVVTKKGKILKIKTIKKAKVTVKAKKAKLGKAKKTVVSNKKGIAKIKFKKPIKKVTVKVIIKKKGYKTFKKTYKF